MNRGNHNNAAITDVRGGRRTPLDSVYRTYSDFDYLLELREHLDSILAYRREFERFQELGLCSAEVERFVEFARTLGQFFKDAFCPGASEKQTDFGASFETVLQLAHTNARYAGHLNWTRPETSTKECRVLELACGPAPLLASLFRAHLHGQCDEVGKCKVFGPVISYLGVDLDLEESKLFRFHYGEQAKVLRRCFAKVEFEQANLTSAAEMAKVISQGPFDYITLSNVLHELPPSSWPGFFAGIPEILSENGVFVLLDLCPQSRFSVDLWAADRLMMPPRFWEADAVWISFNDAVKLLEAAGLAIANRAPTEGEHDDWWSVSGKHDPGDHRSHRERQEAVQSEVEAILDAQGRAFRESLSSERVDTVHRLGEKSFGREGIPFGLRYLALCASQVARESGLLALRDEYR